MTIRLDMVHAGISPIASGAIVGSLQNNVTALGAIQTNAYTTVAAITVFSVCAAGKGAILRPDLGAGEQQILSNLGNNTLSVYPPVGGTIDGGVLNAAVNLAAGKAAAYICRDNLNFVSLLGA